MNKLIAKHNSKFLTVNKCHTILLPTYKSISSLLFVCFHAQVLLNLNLYGRTIINYVIRTYSAGKIKRPLYYNIYN